jgi:hypothetical protein
MAGPMPMCRPRRRTEISLTSLGRTTTANRLALPGTPAREARRALVRMQKDPEAAGQSAHRLTDLPTRPVGTGKTTRDTRDAQRDLRLVSEMRRNVGAWKTSVVRLITQRRWGESVTAEVTATTSHDDSSGPTATATDSEVVTFRQVAALN